jgi:hypothetical protein
MTMIFTRKTDLHEFLGGFPGQDAVQLATYSVPENKPLDCMKGGEIINIMFNDLQFNIRDFVVFSHLIGWAQPTVSVCVLIGACFGFYNRNKMAIMRLKSHQFFARFCR